ncbi:hypothetical protein NQZ79_g601 [Umbelopsis isabellina]|nr:hypothetical protein NQZ79_g601 [Umbelopsis isabellina]
MFLSKTSKVLASSATKALLHTSAPVSHGIKRVGVIGSGQMGLGIAMVTANISRLPVVIMDVNKEQIDKGIKFMDKLLEKDVNKSKITSDHAQKTKDLVSTTQSLKDLADVDIVIEAASENVALKTALFTDLDKYCKPDAILATNTSSISITKIAAATARADQVIGMHFMNPVPVMKLVEIIPGLATTDNVVQTTKELATSMGKTCTVVQDVPGFVANRLLMPYINEAVLLLENGWASAEDIDTTMKLGMNMPMGPLTLADFIGLDTCLAIMKVIHENTGDTKYRPSVLLQNRPILVLSACKLPDPSIIDYDLILSDQFVENDYVLVFLAAPAQYRPPWMWLLKAYRALDRRYKKNLKALHVVHLTRTYRMIFDLANRITSPKFAKKLQYYSFLSELNQEIPIPQLNLPDSVKTYDETLPRPDNAASVAHRGSKPLPGLAFGVSLEKLAEFENIHDETSDYVPSVVKQIVEHLRGNGLLKKGIFRKSPSSEELKFVKDEFNRGQKVDLGKYDINVTASLLKVFFRDLPQAPLSLEFLEAVDQVSDVTKRFFPLEESLEYVDHLKAQFEKYYGTQTKHKALLKYLFSFLRQVCEHADENLMTVHNIAVIFAPNLLRADNDSDMGDPAAYLQQMNKGMGLVRCLVQESDRVIELSN